MADFATSTDLEAFWRPLDDSEEERATDLLRYASAMLRNEWPDIDERIAEYSEIPRPHGSLDPDIAAFVVLSMVKRAMVTGDGGENVQAQMDVWGPFTQQQSYANPMGNMYLTKAERRMLTPKRLQGKAFTLNLISPTAGRGLPYWVRDPQ